MFIKTNVRCVSVTRYFVSVTRNFVGTLFLEINLSIGTSSTWHCPVAFNAEASKVMKNGTWRFGVT
jgi:hypothetical protein